MDFELPDNLFIRHRLHQVEPGRFFLEATFRAELLSRRPVLNLPLLPPCRATVLEEVPALTRHLSSLLLLGPGMLGLAEAFAPLVRRIVELDRKSPDGGVAAMLLCPRQDYTAHHSICTALLACRFARALNFDEGDVYRLAMAALVMNLGAASLHNEMARQESPPSSLQRMQLRMHPLVSSALLREGGVEDDNLHALVLSHHERLDGRGYPFGLPDEDIVPAAQLLHLLDVVVAKLTPRSYRSRMTPKQALSQLYHQTHEPFAPIHVSRLVKTLGVFPAGSFVELENGQTAIVVEQTESAATPLVATLSRGAKLIETSSPGQRIRRDVTLRVGERHLPLFIPFWRLE
ncbi:HD-GYP domain-containing protein [Crenobacter cavernae]|uniref:Phosphohydrolase n=1 Tax=Crenobacter cavernae TaxID=2290923 RepID=A0ABY0FAH4_9NEIS|nr:HD domain-containing phosphohydrolase [Crenobacter cavernae]RXZ42641.1 phosphohydrolase [Crenobacter cavernae]